MRHGRSGLVGLAVALAVLGGSMGLGSCGDPDDCTPGESIACECLDGEEGAQECTEDGTFGSCFCGDDPEPTGASASGAGTSSGSTAASATGASTTGAASSTGGPVQPCWHCCCVIANQTSCDEPGGVNSGPTCPLQCTGMCSDGTTQQCLPHDCNEP